MLGGQKMKRYELLNSWLIGHAAIDEDHRNLISVINSLADAIEANDHKKCDELFTAFLEMAHKHFEREEAVLREAAFPNYDSHCKYHQELIEQSAEVKKLCLEQKDEKLLQGCFEKLMAYLIDDVVRADLEFKSHLYEKGIVS